RVEIWRSDPERVRLTEVLVAADDLEGSRALAVRSAELLGLLATRAQPHRSRGSQRLAGPEGPEGPEAPLGAHEDGSRAKPPRPRFGVGAGIAAGSTLQGPVAAFARLRLQHMPHPRVGVVVVGTAPLVSTTTEARAGGLGVGPRFVLRRPDAVLVPDLSATVGMSLVDRGAPPVAVGARVDGAAGLELAVSPRIRLRGEGAVGICARTLPTRSEHRLGSARGPLVLGALGLGVVF
ncbi:MAG: hypothetical protein KDK70_41570, partial [Myxococcales bacterium]|nr:hypothetical protein [Myxococcales bacterium]